VLLYIHRSYLARAIKIDPANPLNNRYGASVMSAFRSASLLIAGLRSLHGRHPKLTSQMWFFWSGVYSSCVRLLTRSCIVETDSFRIDCLGCARHREPKLQLERRGAAATRPRCLSLCDALLAEMQTSWNNGIYFSPPPPSYIPHIALPHRRPSSSYKSALTASIQTSTQAKPTAGSSNLRLETKSEIRPRGARQTNYTCSAEVGVSSRPVHHSP
jgi:hypothetical protein